MTELSIEISLPQIVDGVEPFGEEVARYARRAEELGFGGLWVSELTPTTILDPLTTLSFCAGFTSRVRLGAAVILTALRSPLHLAQETATLDRLSGGRLVLGVGLGSNRDLYRAHGLTPKGRVARFEEGLQILKRLWEQGSANYPGTIFELDGTQRSPRSTQRPGIPIWFGARSVPGIERAVRMGHGWIGSGSEPLDNFVAQAAELQQILDRHGIERDSFPVAKRIYLEVTDEPERGLEHAVEWFGAHYGKPEMGTSVAVVGSPERCVEVLTEVVAAGVTTVILNPMRHEREQMEILASEVVPRLTQAIQPTA